MKLPGLCGERAASLNDCIVSPPAAMSGMEDILLSCLSCAVSIFSAGVGVTFFVFGLYYDVELDPARRQLVKSESFLPLLPGICFIISIGD